MQVRTLQDVTSLGTILSVWAHPDDETFSCAGIMAAARMNGQQVICVTATRGEAGVQNESRWPAAQLADIRSRELMAALKILGIQEHHFLGYKDGECALVPPAEGKATLLRYIEQYSPDSLLIFGPDGMTGHPDHITVGEWARRAALVATKRPDVYEAIETYEKYEQYLKAADRQFNIYFNIDHPPLCDAVDCDIFFTLTEEICRLKCAALQAMPSQTEGLMQALNKETQRAMFGSEAFKRRSL